jgi:hypothetical protein
MHASTRQSPRQFGKSSSTSLVLRQVPGKGRGVFAGRTFRRGEEVLEFFGDVKDFADLGDDLDHALQVGPRDFMAASGLIDDYVNHSCDPNCGIRNDNGRIVLFALRDVPQGEEITFDYSTTQMNNIWGMKCACGTTLCRGEVRDFVELPATVKARYVSLRAVLPFLVEAKAP